MACLNTNEVVGFLSGQLSPADLAGVERHLDACAACRLLVTELAKAEAPEDGAPPAAEQVALATTAPLGIQATAPPSPRGPETPAAATTDVEAALLETTTVGGHRVVREIPGRYQVREELRRGGQARILLAFDTFMGREVALKELLVARPDAPPSAPGAENAAAQARRFLREARITAHLTHPAIVHVYEVGRRTDGALYYTMPLVRGRTLAEAILGCADLPERLALLGHFEALCQGVAYAHSQGVIHRDIKPENVMIGAFGETILLDWGLAKHVGRGEDAEARHREGQAEEALTAAGMTVGTPAYMSPEQAAGQLGAVDERSDIWGLGTVLYTLLAGKVPFTGDSTAQLVERVLTARYPPVCTVCPAAPPALAALAEWALGREREQRPQSVVALLAGLAEGRAALEPVAVETTSAPTSDEAAFRDPAQADGGLARAKTGGNASAPLTWGLALVALLALGGLGWSLQRGSAARQARQRLAREAAVAQRTVSLARGAQAALAQELAAAHLARARQALGAQRPAAAKVFAAAALVALRHVQPPPPALREAALLCYARAARPAGASHPLRGNVVTVSEPLRRADPRRLLADAERAAGFTLTADLAHTEAPPPRRP